MAKMTTEAFDIRFKFEDKFLRAEAIKFVNKGHKMIPDFRVQLLQPVEGKSKAAESVFTFYVTKDPKEPLFFFPLKKKAAALAQTIAKAIVRKQLKTKK